MKRVLFLATTTGYQTRAFGEAAERLGVKLVFATDRCDQLDDPWWDGAIPIRFHREDASVDAIVQADRQAPLTGILAVGDRATVIAALTAERLGLPGHPAAAAMAARDKLATRVLLRDAGLPAPRFLCIGARDEARHVADRVEWPAVIKPLILSGSRGVMRVNDSGEFLEGIRRLRSLLRSDDVRVLQDPAADTILIESFIEGREYAVEGLLDRGSLHVLAIFDKPDPLDGPFFEETIYVTPSRVDHSTGEAIRDAVARAVAVLGLRHGPIHAECRVNEQGVFVLEVAARPIGGLCAGALEFIGPAGERIGLEELLLRHALGESPSNWRLAPEASGVMMIPIPRSGVYREVHGVVEARQVPGITDVRITAKPDQQLLQLPEGASYLGFIFARGTDPASVEAALRSSHARLDFAIDRAVPVL